MQLVKLITDLTKYTDFNKARALDQLIADMQDILVMYQDVPGGKDAIIAEVTARLLSHTWDLLIKNGEDSGPINS